MRLSALYIVITITTDFPAFQRHNKCLTGDEVAICKVKG